jgi:hypothetical protein
MTELLTEVTGVMLAAILGLCGGYLMKRWEVRYQRRKAENDVWAAQRQTHWSPLLGATRGLEERFTFLRHIYQRRPDMPFSPESLSADFRELYAFSRDEIRNLQEVDANAPRRSPDRVQHMRARVCHELTFAESSVYKTATYLGHAEHVLRDLEDDRLEVSAEARDDLRRLIRGVRRSLQGQSGAGVFEEQQEYIGQMMCDRSGRAMTNLEFRQRLFDLPGWEGFKNVLRFFADFEPKVDYEIKETIDALGCLAARLDQLRASATRDEYRPEIASRSPVVLPRPVGPPPSAPAGQGAGT